jgi:transcriptional regulator with XRE-family HTH domain
MFLGKNLQYLRKNNGNMTQERLAEKLGVSRQTVSRWESSEAYPEIPKLLDLCEIFRCQLDDLLRKDMNERSGAYLPIRLVRVERFRMAQYVMISANARQDVHTYMDIWAKNSTLTSLVPNPLRICWDFPYVSAEQKSRFGLNGCGCGWILPEDFSPACGGPECIWQETADYALMTIQDPFAPGFNRISHAYRMIMEYLSANSIRKSASPGILPCFEHRYEKDGTVYVDIFVHCETVPNPEQIIKFI